MSPGILMRMALFESYDSQLSNVAIFVRIRFELQTFLMLAFSKVLREVGRFSSVFQAFLGRFADTFFWLDNFLKKHVYLIHC